MQMPNATPQGLAGLMQQRPQAPQMPTPGKASPMAGLGGVDDRVSAYRGNTKPLEQRYAMSQDLLDLLALQKIKSQKDAAARQMQLQMAQQGQEDGQANMTVAQQREQEVESLTKNELAAQRGDTAQKQAGDQQAMMQKMMGGIARAPGADMAAQPKAMAAGGIVGYAGPQGSLVSGSPDEEKSSPAGRLFRDTFKPIIERRASAQERGQLRNAIIEKFGTKAGIVGMFAQQSDAQRAQAQQIMARIDRMPVDEMRQILSAGAPAAGLPVSEAQATAAAGPQAAVPPDSKLPPADVVAAAQGAPKPPAPPGIAGLPGAAAAPAITPGAVGPANDFGKKLEAAALNNAEIDPAARQLSEEKRVEDRMALTPEQRKVHEEGIGGLQKMYNEQYDPERQQREGLIRALIGAGGRRYNEFGAAASAGMEYDDQQRASKLKEFGDVQKARTGLIDIDRANVKGGIDAGQKAYEQSSVTQRQGMESGSRMYNTDVGSSDARYSTDVGSRDKALDREVDRLKVAAQNAATAATTAAVGDANLQSHLNTIDNNRDRVIQAIQKQFESQKAMLSMQPQTDPKVKQKVYDLNLMIENEIAKRTKPFDESRALVEAKFYGSSGGNGGYSVTKRPSK